MIKITFLDKTKKRGQKNMIKIAFLDKTKKAQKGRD